MLKTSRISESNLIFQVLSIGKRIKMSPEDNDLFSRSGRRVELERSDSGFRRLDTTPMEGFNNSGNSFQERRGSSLNSSRPGGGFNIHNNPYSRPRDNNLSNRSQDIVNGEPNLNIGSPGNLSRSQDNNVNDNDNASNDESSNRGGAQNNQNDDVNEISNMNSDDEDDEDDEFCDEIPLREIGDDAVWCLSSAKPGNGVEQLRDDSADTFWQSDGPQPHLVNVQFMKKNKSK